MTIPKQLMTSSPTVPIIPLQQNLGFGQPCGNIIVASAGLRSIPSHCSSRKADDEDEQVTESDLQLQNRKVEEAEAPFDEDEAEENT